MICTAKLKSFRRSRHGEIFDRAETFGLTAGLAKLNIRHYTRMRGLLGVRLRVKTIALHLERLRRHYEAAVRTYDHVSLLDLSHSLRIWAELKSELPKLVPAFGTTMSFKTAIPAKKVLKASNGYRYVFCYMPGGVITYCSNGHLASGPEMDHGAGDFSAGIAVKMGQDHMWLNKFCVVGRSFDQSLIKALEAESVTRCNYVQWLGSEAVRVSFLKEDGTLAITTISREMMVKRVAKEGLIYSPSEAS